MFFDINTTDTEVMEAFGEGARGKTGICRSSLSRLPWLTLSVLITGPSQTGIGSQVAISLAGGGLKTLILAGRNNSKIQPVSDEIARLYPDIELKIVNLDLNSNDSVRKAVEHIKSFTSQLDVLINNAGVMATRNFQLSKDGVESQFASNYLGHFLLTNLLLKEGLVKSGGTILNVGSLGYQMADVEFDDINFQVCILGNTSHRSFINMLKNGSTYNGWKAYGQAKSAQLLGTRGLANRLKGKKIAVLIAHPGGTSLQSLQFSW